MYCLKYHFLLALNLSLAVNNFILSTSCIKKPMNPVPCSNIYASYDFIHFYHLLQNIGKWELCKYTVKNKQANCKERGRTVQLLILSECFIHRSTITCSYSSWERSCIHFSHHTLLICCHYAETLNYTCIMKFSSTASILALSFDSNSFEVRQSKQNQGKKGKKRSIVGRKVFFM